MDVDLLHEKSVIDHSARHDVRVMRELKLGRTVARRVDVLVCSAELVIDLYAIGG